MNGSNFDREISFDIVEHLGVITTYSTGWNKELNLVSWNGAAPKYDIREWSPDHAHMSRGVTLHEKEMRTILDLIRNRNRKSRYDSRGAGSSSVSRPGVPDGETQRRREECDDGVSTGQRACAAKACSETAGGGDAADRGRLEARGGDAVGPPLIEPAPSRIILSVRLRRGPNPPR